MHQNTTPNNNTIEKIGDGQYVLLNNNQVARLLTPTKKQNKIYFNLRIEGKTKLNSIEKIQEIVSQQTK